MTLESNFGYLLAQALTQWCDIGRYDGRRLDDLLFNEYDPARDGDFSNWVQAAEYEEYQPGAAKDGEPIPEHQSIGWPLMIIQAAIYSREPERIAQILADETDYELERIADNDWVDLDGNPVPLDPEQVQDDQRAVMSWAANWRRTFGNEEARRAS
jgi:hypothetical protein